MDISLTRTGNEYLVLRLLKLKEDYFPPFVSGLKGSRIKEKVYSMRRFKRFMQHAKGSPSALGAFAKGYQVTFYSGYMQRRSCLQYTAVKT